MKTLQTDRKPFSVLYWTWLCSGGWVAGVMLILLLSGFLDAAGVEDWQFHIGLGMGGAMGMAQWLSLRRSALVNLNWILFAAAGMGIPFLILDLLPAGSSGEKLPWSVIAGSLCSGLLQSLLLRNYTAPYRWVLFSFLSWTSAALLVLATGYTMQLGISNLLIALLNLLLILSGGFVAGLISGAGMKRILNQ